jgi:hypothetical protein
MVEARSTAGGKRNGSVHLHMGDRLAMVIALCIGSAARHATPSKSERCFWMNRSNVRGFFRRDAYLTL